MSDFFGNQQEEHSLEHVTAYLLEPLIHLRREYRAALSAEGIGSVHEFENTHDLIAALQERVPDILIADADQTQGALSAFMQTVRRCGSDVDPFFPVVMLSWRTDMRLVGQMAKAGADDILAKPVSTGRIVERVKHLVGKRKPFVVTSEYVGPDRRNIVRASDEEGLIKVPNSLELKAYGQFKQDDYDAQVYQARRDVENRRIQSYGERLNMLALVLSPLLISAQDEEGQIERGLKEIVKLSERLVKQVENTKFGHVRELGDSLLDVASRLNRDQARSSIKDRQLLAPMAKAVHRAVFPDVDEDKLALSIAQRVQNYKERK